MIFLAPLPRRFIYVILFEGLAIVFSSLLLAKMNDGEAHESIPVAIAASLAAVVWNFTYNTIFETWEKSRGIEVRSLSVRALHTAGFEGGLLIILIPLFMWWYSIGPIVALSMEAGLLVFFLVFTFLFTWLFDTIVKKKRTIAEVI